MNTRRPTWQDSSLRQQTSDLEYHLQKPTLAGMAMAAVWVIGALLLISIVLDHPIWQFH